MAEGIVVDQKNPEVTTDPLIANIAAKLPASKPAFSMAGVVTDEFESAAIGEKKKEDIPVQTASVIKEETFEDENKGTETQVQPEKKVSKKKEPTAPVVTETKTDDKKFSADQRKAAFDFIGEEMEEETTSTEVSQTSAETKIQPKSTPLPKEVEEELTGLKSKVEQYENDPVIKKAVELVTSSGGDIKKMVAQLDLNDYDAMSADDIFEMDLKSKKLTEDQIDEAKAEFDAQSDYKKNIQADSIREGLKRKADEKNTKFLSAPTVSPEVQKHRQEQVQVAITSLDEITQKLSTKGYMGFYQPDSEDVDLIKGYSLSNPVVVEKQGKQYYDMQKTVDNAIWNTPQVRKKLLKVYGEIMKEAGYELKIKERTRVSAQDFAPGSHSMSKTTFSDVIKGQKIVTPAEN